MDLMWGISVLIGEGRSFNVVIEKEGAIEV